MDSAIDVARARAWNRATMVERNVEVALLMLVVILPLKSALDLDRLLEVGTVPVVSLTKLAGLWFFASFLLYAITVQRDLRLDALHVVLLGLTALAIASTLQARVPAAALATTFRYASFVALFVAFTQLLDDPSLQLRTVWALVSSCAVAACISIGNLLLGRSLIATLPYGDPNDVAFMLATALPLGVWLLAHERRWRAVILLMVAAITVSVMLSLSRGAVVGLIAAVVGQIVLDRRQVRTILIGCLVAMLAAALLIVLNPAQVRRGLESKQKVAWANVTNRLQAWGEATRLTVDHPLLGVGPGNFQFYYADRWQPGMHRLRVAHNTFLDVAAELGLPAFCLFITYLGVSFARLTALRRALPLPDLAAALRSSLIVAAVAGFFVSGLFFAPFWLLGALADGLWQSGSSERVPGR